MEVDVTVNSAIIKAVNTSQKKDEMWCTLKIEFPMVSDDSMSVVSELIGLQDKGVCRINFTDVPSAA